MFKKMNVSRDLQLVRTMYAIVSTFRHFSRFLKQHCQFPQQVLVFSFGACVVMETSTSGHQVIVQVYLCFNLHLKFQMTRKIQDKNQDSSNFHNYILYRKISRVYLEGIRYNFLIINNHLKETYSKLSFLLQTFHLSHFAIFSYIFLYFQIKSLCY